MSKLYEHLRHPHVPRNINEVHRQERAAQANAYTLFNERAAVWLTLLFSTMELFWLIDLFMAVWIIGNSAGFWHFDPLPYPLLLMVINIPQLPLLPLLAIGQKVLSRKQELQADEAYQTTMRSFSDIEQIMNHLDKQDQVILEILQRLEQATAPTGGGIGP
jgi:uncharacterized membrane protein